MKKELEKKAKILRAKGYSVKELHNLLGVSKDTASRWIQGVELSDNAKARLQQNYTKGQIASQKTIKEKTRKKNQIAYDFSEDFFKKVNLDKNSYLLFCAMIYHCEGSKSIKDSVTFTNSDPNLIKTFLFLFRKSFDINESKLRVLMHLHGYHNEDKQKIYWSKVTNIPISKFLKTYNKPTNGLYKKEGYQGCIQVRYRDVEIGRKLGAVAKMFMERYK